MTVFNQLLQLRSAQGQVITHGLNDDAIKQFIASDPHLVEAINLAADQFDLIKANYPQIIDMDEADQLSFMSADYINFYAADAVNPYVALSGKGPWGRACRTGALAGALSGLNAIKRKIAARLATRCKQRPYLACLQAALAALICFF